LVKGKKNFKRIEGRLDEIKAKKKTPSDKRYISSTDPDASVTRHGKGRSKLRYKTHRVVDPANEVITATALTPGSIDDGHMLETLIEEHEKNTGQKVETAVADSKYGTMDNFLLCQDKKIKAHMPSIEKRQRRTGVRKGIFPPEAFIYSKDTDTFTCPAGKVLRKRTYYKKKNQFEYKAHKDVCAQCELRDQCTKAKAGRTVKRHIRQDELDGLINKANSPKARKDIRERQDLSERSFAASTRHGLKRARWRGQWRMQIQDFLIATIQNILILISKPNIKISKSNTMEKEVNTRARVGLCYLFYLVSPCISFHYQKNGLNFRHKHICSS
jgi:hypothetical protein